MRSGNYMKMLGVLTGVMILFAGCGIESANTHMGTSKKVEAETVDESDQTVVKKKNYTAIKQENCPNNIFSRGQIAGLIQKYSPTMLLVEHDRAFAESVSTRRIYLSSRSSD